MQVITSYPPPFPSTFLTIPRDIVLRSIYCSHEFDVAQKRNKMKFRRRKTLFRFMEVDGLVIDQQKRKEKRKKKEKKKTISLILVSGLYNR